MNRRDPEAAATYGEDASYDDLLSPCETYEGSRHYAVSLDEAEIDAESLNDTVVMSPALLAKLRAELIEQAAREPLHTRPTQRSMPAVRLDGRR